MRRLWSEPKRLVLIYLLFASALILLTDSLLYFVFNLPEYEGLIQSARGLILVGFSAYFFYLLSSKQKRSHFQEEENLRSIIGSMADAVLVVSENFEVVDANPAALQLVGVHEKSDLLGPLQKIRDTFQLRTPEGREIRLDETASYRALKGKVPQRYEALITRANGTSVPVSITSSAIHNKEPGHDKRVVTTVRDLSEEKSLEKLRKDFLATAAHELKTPLTTVQAYIQLMKEWSEEEKTANEKAALEVLARQTQRLSGLINELLEVSRLDLNRLELRRTHEELNTIVKRVVRQVLPMASKHHVHFTPGEPIAVFVDHERIEQILFNLLSNAIKFSPEGGHIAVEVSHDTKDATVCVTDEGMGIPREKQNEVFERFFRAHHRSGFDFASGMGLGLHISREFAQKHGGNIRFQSQEGVGSTFCLDLPVEDKRKENHDQERPLPQEHHDH